MALPAASETFAPGGDGSAYRRALGRFATGVTIITAQAEGAPIGITVNSFASVSLSPPLVLWSPDKKSARHNAFVAAQHYAIHVLAADQEALCRAFVRSRSAFDGLAVETGAHNVPLLEGCLARFECVQTSTHDAGDHTIILGEVHSVSERDAAPLIFSAGQFTQLA